ncbi:MAG: glycoside hydrolase family 15 protein [Burkholderiales bacterium]
MASEQRYPPIADYALIADCHSSALVSKNGSIDWCCMPRFDSDSCFGRLLDWDKGGCFAIAPVDEYSVSREYHRETLVLITTFRTSSGEARLIDFFAMREGGRTNPRRQLLRIIEGVSGQIEFHVRISPRFDYGAISPWINPCGENRFTAVASNEGLYISGDVPLALEGKHDLFARVTLEAGERARFSLWHCPPEELDDPDEEPFDANRVDCMLEETLVWWKTFSAKTKYRDDDGAGVVRSAIVLKAMGYAPTGAIIAAPTTSLPEALGGERNWDYRFSWIRDSIFTVHALADLGCAAEANAFRRFIQRSSAGSPNQLQVVYGIDGRRRLTEIEFDFLEGWRGAKPVRIGNAADAQFQLDMYGFVLELAWRWSERGNSPEEHYWTFLRALVEEAAKRWRDPDRGIWEVRGPKKHFVHSKAMCWATLNRGIHLAKKHGFDAPIGRWQEIREEIRKAIESRGYDTKRGVFVQAFNEKEMDAALLLLPDVEFVAYDDARMMRTSDAIREDLSEDGLILRYRNADGLPSKEGVFLACTFWLVECLAYQGRGDEAKRVFDGVMRCANDVGLFAEEFDPSTGEMLGNFPQALTHLAHISAALALNKAQRLQ